MQYFVILLFIILIDTGQSAIDCSYEDGEDSSKINLKISCSLSEGALMQDQQLTWLSEYFQQDEWKQCEPNVKLQTNKSIPVKLSLCSNQVRITCTNTAMGIYENVKQYLSIYDKDEISFKVIRGDLTFISLKELKNIHDNGIISIEDVIAKNKGIFWNSKLSYFNNYQMDVKTIEPLWPHELNQLRRFCSYNYQFVAAFLQTHMIDLNGKLLPNQTQIFKDCRSLQKQYNLIYPKEMSKDDIKDFNEKKVETLFEFGAEKCFLPYYTSARYLTQVLILSSDDLNEINVYIEKFKTNNLKIASSIRNDALDVQQRLCINRPPPLIIQVEQKLKQLELFYLQMTNELRLYFESGSHINFHISVLIRGTTMKYKSRQLTILHNGMENGLMEMKNPKEFVLQVGQMWKILEFDRCSPACTATYHLLNPNDIHSIEWYGITIKVQASNGINDLVNDYNFGSMTDTDVENKGLPTTAYCDDIDRVVIHSGQNKRLLFFDNEPIHLTNTIEEPCLDRKQSLVCGTQFILFVCLHDSSLFCECNAKKTDNEEIWKNIKIKGLIAEPEEFLTELSANSIAEEGRVYLNEIAKEFRLLCVQQKLNLNKNCTNAASEKTINHFYEIKVPKVSVKYTIIGGDVQWWKIDGKIKENYLLIDYSGDDIPSNIHIRMVDLGTNSIILNDTSIELEEYKQRNQQLYTSISFTNKFPIDLFGSQFIKRFNLFVKLTKESNYVKFIKIFNIVNELDNKIDSVKLFCENCHNRNPNYWIYDTLTFFDEFPTQSVSRKQLTDLEEKNERKMLINIEIKTQPTSIIEKYMKIIVSDKNNGNLNTFYSSALNSDENYMVLNLDNINELNVEVGNDDGSYDNLLLKLTDKFTYLKQMLDFQDHSPNCQCESFMREIIQLKYYYYICCQCYGDNYGNGLIYEAIIGKIDNNIIDNKLTVLYKGIKSCFRVFVPLVENAENGIFEILVNIKYLYVDEYVGRKLKTEPRILLQKYKEYSSLRFFQYLNEYGSFQLSPFKGNVHDVSLFLFYKELYKLISANHKDVPSFLIYQIKYENEQKSVEDFLRKSIYYNLGKFIEFSEIPTNSLTIKFPTNFIFNGIYQLLNEIQSLTFNWNIDDLDSIQYLTNKLIKTKFRRQFVSHYKILIRILYLVHNMILMKLNDKNFDYLSIVNSKKSNDCIEGTVGYETRRLNELLQMSDTNYSKLIFDQLTTSPLKKSLTNQILQSNEQLKSFAISEFQSRITSFVDYIIVSAIDNEKRLVTLSPLDDGRLLELQYDDFFANDEISFDIGLLTAYHTRLPNVLSLFDEPIKHMVLEPENEIPDKLKDKMNFEINSIALNNLKRNGIIRLRENGISESNKNYIVSSKEVDENELNDYEINSKLKFISIHDSEEPSTIIELSTISDNILIHLTSQLPKDKHEQKIKNLIQSKIVVIPNFNMFHRHILRIDELTNKNQLVNEENAYLFLNIELIGYHVNEQFMKENYPETLVESSFESRKHYCFLHKDTTVNMKKKNFTIDILISDNEEFDGSKTYSLKNGKSEDMDETILENFNLKRITPMTRKGAALTFFEIRKLNDSIYEEIDHMDIVMEISVSLISCIYFDSIEKKWKGNGCTIDGNTNVLSSIQCNCNHLTPFSAKVRSIDLSINFDTITRIDVSENIVPLFIVLLVFISLMVCCICVRIFFKEISHKYLISVGERSGSFKYEISIHTGWLTSGTTSCVGMKLHGTKGSSVRTALKAPVPSNDIKFKPSKHLFQRGCENNFLFSCNDDLGHLTSISLWHNAAGNRPYWFIRSLIVKDIQNDSIYLTCPNDWLIVDPLERKSSLTSTTSSSSSVGKMELNNLHLNFQLFQIDNMEDLDGIEKRQLKNLNNIFLSNSFIDYNLWINLIFHRIIEPISQLSKIFIFHTTFFFILLFALINYVIFNDEHELHVNNSKIGGVLGSVEIIAALITAVMGSIIHLLLTLLIRYVTLKERRPTYLFAKKQKKDLKTLQLDNSSNQNFDSSRQTSAKTTVAINVNSTAVLKKSFKTIKRTECKRKLSFGSMSNDTTYTDLLNSIQPKLFTVEEDAPSNNKKKSITSVNRITKNKNLPKRRQTSIISIDTSIEEDTIPQMKENHQILIGQQSTDNDNFTESHQKKFKIIFGITYSLLLSLMIFASILIIYYGWTFQVAVTFQWFVTCAFSLIFSFTLVEPVKCWIVYKVHRLYSLKNSRRFFNKYLLLHDVDKEEKKELIDDTTSFHSTMKSILLNTKKLNVTTNNYPSPLNPQYKHNGIYHLKYHDDNVLLRYRPLAGYGYEKICQITAAYFRIKETLFVLIPIFFCVILSFILFSPIGHIKENNHLIQHFHKSSILLSSSMNNMDSSLIVHEFNKYYFKMIKYYDNTQHQLSHLLQFQQFYQQQIEIIYEESPSIHFNDFESILNLTLVNNCRSFEKVCKEMKENSKKNYWNRIDHLINTEKYFKKFDECKIVYQEDFRHLNCNYEKIPVGPQILLKGFDSKFVEYIQQILQSNSDNALNFINSINIKQSFIQPEQIDNKPSQLYLLTTNFNRENTYLKSNIFKSSFQINSFEYATPFQYGALLISIALISIIILTMYFLIRYRQFHNKRFERNAKVNSNFKFPHKPPLIFGVFGILIILLINLILLVIQTIFHIYVEMKRINIHSSKDNLQIIEEYSSLGNFMEAIHYIIAIIQFTLTIALIYIFMQLINFYRNIFVIYRLATLEISLTFVRYVIGMIAFSSVIYLMNKKNFNISDYTYFITIFCSIGNRRFMNEIFKKNDNICNFIVVVWYIFCLLIVRSFLISVYQFYLKTIRLQKFKLSTTNGLTISERQSMADIYVYDLILFIKDIIGWHNIESIEKTKSSNNKKSILIKNFQHKTKDNVIIPRYETKQQNQDNKMRKVRFPRDITSASTIRSHSSSVIYEEPNESHLQEIFDGIVDRCWKEQVKQKDTYSNNDNILYDQLEMINLLKMKKNIRRPSVTSIKSTSSNDSNISSISMYLNNPNRKPSKMQLTNNSKIPKLLARKRSGRIRPNSFGSEESFRQKTTLPPHLNRGRSESRKRSQIPVYKAH
ncbi:hypothetical protein SNEBB_008624 [Seison nebaliae]|nr:hypothetical protein SNEBB_008624 [Seison nebaliae]